MTWGSLVDCLVTSPEDFDNQFAVSEFDNFRTDVAKEWKAEALESGKNIITDDLLSEAKKAVSVLTEKHKFSASIIEKSQKQVVLLNKIKHPSVDKSVNVKALLDLAPEGADYLVDLKTTNDFTPSGFEKAIANFGYHVQAAHYLNSWNALNPNDQRSRFLIVWQDSKAPYEVAVTELPQVDISDGNDLFNFLLGKILRAAGKNYFPMKFEKPILLGRAGYSVFSEGQEIEGYTINE